MSSLNRKIQIEMIVSLRCRNPYCESEGGMQDFHQHDNGVIVTSFTLSSRCTYLEVKGKASFSYEERRWFANRRRRPRGPKQQRRRGPRRRFAN